jgi:phosphatidylserine/phosphatidylglycerophosphate/cardiolipin synthase-like enzyme
MLKETLINSGEIYIGRNVGERIITDLESSKKSIKIVTPYISADFVDLLVQYAKSNIDITLILSDDFVDKEYKRNEIFKKIIKQKRHTDENKKKKRRIGFGLVYVSYLIITLFLIIGFKEKIQHFEYAGFLFPLFFLLHFIIKKIPIYSYTYEHLIKFAIIMTPYSIPNKFNDNHYLTHSKIFIFDDRIAYMGSMNFTKMGFYKNYETRVKIIEENVIKSISSEIDDLFSNSNTYYLNLDVLAKSIYIEPRH